MNSTETLESRLKALQCHFTWNLEANRQNLVYLRYRLQDISTEEGNVWLGHIYNLQGFIQYKLGSSEEALNIFRRATETFQRLKNSDEGPWLMVNFGNLAWLHHLMGEDEKSQDYLSKVEALMREYPAPPEEELYPEVCAEKAWTLMKLDKEKKLQAAELFQKAVRMQPDNVEWQSSCAILSAEVFKENLQELYTDMLETLKSAKERDPDNLCIAALYLEAGSAKGIEIKNEALELSEKLKKLPANHYTGIRLLLRLNRKFEFDDNAEEFSKKNQRKKQDRSDAERLKEKIFSKDFKHDKETIDKAIELWEEVTNADPEFSLEDNITLASIYAKKKDGNADQIYNKLLEKNDLDPVGKQMLYNRYAKHLYFFKNERKQSIEFHIKAAEIPEETFYRKSSIAELRKSLNRIQDPEIRQKISSRITEFLRDI
uniref:Uncharacterized protein n=1 Tax=Cyprinodon variegatus TaxID=28743 RepID=A0A3Q2DWU2_CYPVA